MRRGTAICFLLSALLTISAQSAALASAAPAGNTRAFWTVQKSPNPSGNGGFNGVDCTGATACVAVGSYFDNPVKAQVPLAASWSGRAWRVQPTPAPEGTNYSHLDGVSCVGPTFCSAVGTDVLNSGRWITLAEIWRGTRWVIAPTPPLKSPKIQLLAGGLVLVVNRLHGGRVHERSGPHRALERGQMDDTARAQAHRLKVQPALRRLVRHAQLVHGRWLLSVAFRWHTSIQ